MVLPIHLKNQKFLVSLCSCAHPSTMPSPLCHDELPQLKELLNIPELSHYFDRNYLEIDFWKNNIYKGHITTQDHSWGGDICYETQRSKMNCWFF